jgi:cytidylate kinase
MPIVAISETAGSWGIEIGRALATRRGWEFADREVIAKAAERFGEGVQELAHATEERPTLWERIAESQRRYVAYVEATMLELAARDDVVVAGRGAFVVLGRVATALRVRVTADEVVRARRIEQQLGLTPAAALDHVRQTDRERAARIRFLYHLDVDDPSLYDLVLSTDRMGIARGVAILETALEDERFQATPASRRTALDLSLAAQATAVLLADRTLRSRDFHVACTDGVISLTGSVHGEGERRQATDAVAAIPGVTAVQAELLDIRAGVRRPGL